VAAHLQDNHAWREATLLLSGADFTFEGCDHHEALDATQDQICGRSVESELYRNHQ
jgi:hypothetical protein